MRPSIPLLAGLAVAILASIPSPIAAGVPGSPQATAAATPEVALPVLEVTTQAGLEAVLAKATTPVVIDFHATWCGPCRLLAKELDGVLEKHPGAVQLVRIDVDQAADLASDYRVESIPDLALVRNGKVTARRVGFARAAELESWLGLKP